MLWNRINYFILLKNLKSKLWGNPKTSIRWQVINRVDNWIFSERIISKTWRWLSTRPLIIRSALRRTQDETTESSVHSMAKYTWFLLQGFSEAFKDENLSHNYREWIWGIGIEQFAVDQSYLYTGCLLSLLLQSRSYKQHSIITRFILISQKDLVWEWSLWETYYL